MKRGEEGEGECGESESETLMLPSSPQPFASNGFRRMRH